MCTGIPYYQYNVVDLATADTTIGGMVATGQTVITNTGALSCQNAFAIGQALECFANKTDLLLSGMYTLTSQISFEANIGSGSKSGTYCSIHSRLLCKLRSNLDVGQRHSDCQVLKKMYY